MIKALRRVSFGILALYVLSSSPTIALDNKPLIQVYKSESCGCCGLWVKHLEKNGYKVNVTNIGDMNRIKKLYKIPDDMQSCHTGVMENYILEGHVPVIAIEKLLKTKDANLKGLAVPGMPMGAPGMEGPYSDDYIVYALKKRGAPSKFLEIKIKQNK